MLVLGVDEVGRGSIAGPLVVGAVVLDKKIAGLKDSKVLSRRQREELNVIINRRAKYVGLGWVDVQELDDLGLSASLNLAAKRALKNLTFSVNRVVLDGNFNYLDLACETIIKADALIPAVSAAGIVAKVARDKFMVELAKEFPQYMFEKHVGYCTRAHVDALNKCGVSIHHRRSFEPVKSLTSRIVHNIPE